MLQRGKLIWRGLKRYFWSTSWVWLSPELVIFSHANHTMIWFWVGQDCRRRSPLTLVISQPHLFPVFLTLCSCSQAGILVFWVSQSTRSLLWGIPFWAEPLNSKFVCEAQMLPLSIWCTHLGPSPSLAHIPTIQQWGDTDTC